jgi:hypothetical protein
MFHEPKLYGESIEEIQDEEEKKMLIAFRDQLVMILQKNCKKSKEEIEAILKAETWYTAQEAKDNGFLDEIETYSTKPFLRDDMPVQVKMQSIAAFWKDKRNTNLNKEDMKAVKAALGLNEDAAEKNVLDAVSNLAKEKENAETKLVEVSNSLTSVKAENDTLKADLTAKETELNTLKEVVNKIEADKKAAEELAIENEVKAMKFAPEKEARMIELAKANIEMFREVVQSMPVKAIKVTDEIIEEADEVIEGITEAEAKLADEYEKLDKENPVELNNIEATDKARFGKMAAAFIKKNNLK